MEDKNVYRKIKGSTDSFYVPPDDVKKTLSDIMRALHGKTGDEVSEYRKMRVRRININFLRYRLTTLSGENFTRALETMNNLRG